MYRIVKVKCKPNVSDREGEMQSQCIGSWRWNTIEMANRERRNEWTANKSCNCMWSFDFYSTQSSCRIGIHDSPFPRITNHKLLHLVTVFVSLSEFGGTRRSTNFPCWYLCSINVCPKFCVFSELSLHKIGSFCLIQVVARFLYPNLADSNFCSSALLIPSELLGDAASQLAVFL